jgi:hypothetical protein
MFKEPRNRLQGIEESTPSAFVAWRAGTSNRVVVPTRQAGNRFLGSLKGLQIRAQVYQLSIFAPEAGAKFQFLNLAR